MKYLFILVSALLIASLTSCDGKERARTSPKENINHSNLSSTFFVKETYIPETYTEHQRDSVLSNGYQVSIKVTTNEDVALREFQQDTITHKNYYHDFDALIIVKKNDRIVFNQIVNKHFIKNHFSTTNNINDEILTSVWLDDYISTTKNAVEIALSFCEPNSQACLSYNLVIDEQGYTLKPKEKHS